MSWTGPARSKVVKPGPGRRLVLGADLGMEVDPPVVGRRELVHGGDDRRVVLDAELDQSRLPSWHREPGVAGTAQPGPRSAGPSRRSTVVNSSTAWRVSLVRLVHGSAQRHQGRHRHVIGDVEGGADLGLAPDHHRGHDPAQSFGACRQQQAPHEGVHRGPAHEGVAVEVAVDGGQLAQVGEHHEERRDLVEVLGEPARARPRAPAATASASVEGPSLGVVVGDRGPRHEPGRALRQVLVPAREIEVAQGRLACRVAHHDGTPRLAVAAVGREPGRVEETVEDVVVHGVGQEVAHRPRRAQRVVSSITSTVAPRRASGGDVGPQILGLAALGLGEQGEEPGGEDDGEERDRRPDREAVADVGDGPEGHEPDDGAGHAGGHVPPRHRGPHRRWGTARWPSAPAAGAKVAAARTPSS